MNKLIDEAIDASIVFEELMDKTDFDSWLKDDKSGELPEGQDNEPFQEYKNNRLKLRCICREMKREGSKVPPENGDQTSLEKYIVYNLFESKDKRIEARICSKKEDRKKNYKEALYLLLPALNQLQKPKGDNIDKRLLILLYNDLSICYAGFENSSLSRAYAEEARKIIEEEQSYKKFEQKFGTDNSTEMAGIANDEFITTKLYALYTVAVYNQAIAEKRSDFYSNAEKNFRLIKKYAEYKDKEETPLRNFNYYSALFNLSDLYMELSRGKEAIELLDIVLKEFYKDKDKDKEVDIRFWNTYLTKINALIDQSEYKKAKDLLFEKILATGKFKPNEKHKITSTGFKGLNCFVRCIIDCANNELKRIDRETESKLNQAKEFIKQNEEIMKERDPKGSVLKAYRQLSDIYKIVSANNDDNKYDKDIRKYLIKFISEDESDDLDDFIEDSEQMGNWVDKCDDLDALENFADQVIKVIPDEPDELKKIKLKDLLGTIKKKIIEECEDKGQPARAARIVRKIDVATIKEKDYEEFLSNILEKIKMKITEEGENKRQLARAVRKIIVAIKEKDCKEFPSHLIYEDICKRLDINEQEFDKVIFKRSGIEENHIAEVIILKRWNSYSPGLFQEPKGSLGGGYLLRIKRNLYLFSFSDIKKENERQKLLKRLQDLGLAKNMEGAEYSEEKEEISITKDKEKIATLYIKEGFCYLKRDKHDDLKIGVAKKEDNKRNIYSEDPPVENIVIDPGYNFIQSFRNEGFHVEDIDTIIVTHSHLDHCAELLPVMELIYQFNKRYKDTPYKERPRKKVNLCLSKGAYQKISTYIDDPDWNKQLKDVIILENLDKWICESPKGLTISAISTPHIDLGGAHSIGLKIKISPGEEKNFCFGFTSDTPWDLDIKKYFEECDLLCVHLGSMKYSEIGYTDDRYNLRIKDEPRKISSGKLLEELKKTYTEANHLLFHGTLDFIHGTLDFIEKCSGKDEPLIIVGEFGEELKYGLRIDLCEQLCREANKKHNNKKEIVCLPGDIGLYIGIDKDGKKKVRCNFCEHFVKPEKIEIVSYGREDAIHYICKTCNKTLTELQKQAVIEHRVTRH